jgi:hypothetical protein
MLQYELIKECKQSGARLGRLHTVAWGVCILRMER